MKKTAVVIATILGLGLAAGIAYASIPGPDGVIHGCYKTSNPAQGALIAIDSAASCPSGYTALNWSQTGPQGPAGTNGVSGYEVVHQQVTLPYNGGNGTAFQLNCPTGKQSLSGGYNQAPGGDLGNEVASYPSGTGWGFLFYPSVNADKLIDLYTVCASVS